MFKRNYFYYFNVKFREKLVIGFLINIVIINYLYKIKLLV